MAENKQIQSLKKSSDFLFLSKNGTKLRPTKWLTVQYVVAEKGETFVGLTASGKVGNAVLRNKLKRWVRHCVRSNQMPQQFYGKKIVFVFRPQSDRFFSTLDYKEFRTTLESLRFI